MVRLTFAEIPDWETRPMLDTPPFVPLVVKVVAGMLTAASVKVIALHSVTAAPEAAAVVGDWIVALTPGLTDR